mgnify:CR=1 FL=1
MHAASATHHTDVFDLPTRWRAEAAEPLVEALADVDLGLMLQRLLKNGYPLPEALKKYAQAQWERPSVRSFLELPRPANPPP